MTSLELLRTSDAAVSLAGVCLILGWLSGAGVVLLARWRRLTTPTRAEDVRRLLAETDRLRADNVRLRRVLDEAARLVVRASVLESTKGAA